MEATVAWETIKLLEEKNEIISLVPVPRAPSVVVYEPDMVCSDAREESSLPPVPRRSTRSQTP